MQVYSTLTGHKKFKEISNWGITRATSATAFEVSFGVFGRVVPGSPIKGEPANVIFGMWICELRTSQWDSVPKEDKTRPSASFPGPPLSLLSHKYAFPKPSVTLSIIFIICKLWFPFRFSNFPCIFTSVRFNFFLFVSFLILDFSRVRPLDLGLAAGKYEGNQFFSFELHAVWFPSVQNTPSLCSALLSF